MSGPAGPSLLARTRALLDAHGLAPRKARGQHFLIDPRVRDAIVQAADVTPGSTVLEVGPGTGVLTEALLRAGARVLAVELDRGLAGLLQETLGGHPGLTLWVEDALRLDFAARLRDHPARGAIRVVANIPYYITSPLILHLLEQPGLFRLLALTIQREVAERLAAGPGEKAYGALTLACQYRAEVRTALHIPRGAFYPVPEVESRLVRLDVRPAPPVRVPSPERLFAVVRAGFGQRRKTLRNALRGAGWTAAPVEAALAAAGIAGSRRAETLSLEEFARLAAALPGPEAGGPDCESRRALGARARSS
ncbi:MAG: 16S rRNA (adenine(1518)-N(6)/adenine(1519)-N(6))-dimethyltransferase RsmA [Candidatus Methylomirabilales bacterium]